MTEAEDNIEAYHGQLVTITPVARYVGVLEFGDNGVLFRGVPHPYSHEVTGLPDRTCFVPYANVSSFTFDAPEADEDDVDRYVGGSE